MDSSIIASHHTRSKLEKSTGAGEIVTARLEDALVEHPLEYITYTH